MGEKKEKKRTESLFLIILAEKNKD